jgi:hypothetical protein
MNSILEDLYEPDSAQSTILGELNGAPSGHFGAPSGHFGANEPPKKCPLVIMYDQIRAGGWYDDTIDDEELEAQAVFVGGNECYMPDNITYIMNMRGVMMARMKLHGKSPVEILEKMYAIYKGKNESQIFDILLTQSNTYTYVLEQFTKLMSLIANINAYIQKAITIDSSLQLDLSLPDILLPQDSPQNALQKNEVLKAIMNRIIEFISKLNLKPLGIAIGDIAPFTQEPPEISHNDSNVVNFEPNASEEDLQRIRKIELDIAKKVLVYEKYQCDIVNHVNKIFHVIGDQLKN